VPSGPVGSCHTCCVNTNAVKPGDIMVRVLGLQLRGHVYALLLVFSNTCIYTSNDIFNTFIIIPILSR